MAKKALPRGIQAIPNTPYHGVEIGHRPKMTADVVHVDGHFHAKVYADDCLIDDATFDSRQFAEDWTHNTYKV